MSASLCPGCGKPAGYERDGREDVLFCVPCGWRHVERRALLAPLPFGVSPRDLGLMFWADLLKVAASKEDADEMYRKYKACVRIKPVPLKPCAGCGQPTPVSPGPNTFCPACKAARSVKLCRDCGIVIEGKGVRLCAPCRKARRAITNHKYKGTRATRTCERCGEEFVSHPGRNRYCLTCSPIAKKERLRRYYQQRKAGAQS